MVLNWLDESQWHWEGQSALLGLLIQRPTSSRHTNTTSQTHPHKLMDTPRIMLNQTPGNHVPQPSWHKTNHHRLMIWTTLILTASAVPASWAPTLLHVYTQRAQWSWEKANILDWEQLQSHLSNPAGSYAFLSTSSFLQTPPHQVPSIHTFTTPLQPPTKHFSWPYNLMPPRL